MSEVALRFSIITRDPLGKAKECWMNDEVFIAEVVDDARREAGSCPNLEDKAAERGRRSGRVAL